MNTKNVVMFSKLFLGVAVIMAAACGDPDKPVPVTPGDQKLSCLAKFSKSEVSYKLDGDKLQYGNDPDIATLTRVGEAKPDNPLLGTWQYPATAPVDGVTYSGVLKIDSGTVSYARTCAASETQKATAEVTSKASFSDSTVTILEDQEREVKY